MKSLKIVSYNIQYGVGTDGRFDLGRIVDVIGDADIVGLQEVEVAWDRSHNVDIPARLQELMPDHYAAWVPNIDVLKRTDAGWAGARAPRRQFGNMILSRHPILSVRNHLLPRYGAAHLLDMQRGALEATIALPGGGFPGGGLRVYCAHFCHLSDAQRRRQLEHLMAILHRAPAEGAALSGAHDRDLSWSSEAPLPPPPADAIVLGDFNCTPEMESYAVIAGEGSERRGRMSRLDGLLDAWSAARRRVGLTGSGGEPEGATRYPSFPPQPGQGKRVDFCFLPHRFAGLVEEARVPADADGSDHLPLIVTLAPPAPEAGVGGAK